MQRSSEMLCRRQEEAEPCTIVLSEARGREKGIAWLLWSIGMLTTRLNIMTIYLNLCTTTDRNEDQRHWKNPYRGTAETNVKGCAWLWKTRHNCRMDIWLKVMKRWVIFTFYLFPDHITSCGVKQENQMSSQVWPKCLPRPCRDWAERAPLTCERPWTRTRAGRYTQLEREILSRDIQGDLWNSAKS